MRVGQILATLIFASSSSFAFSGAAMAAGTTHDGHWRVDLETTVGTCAKSGSAVLTIKDDRVVSIEPSTIEPWGYIDDTNTFVGHFSVGEKTLHANGEVKGAFGHGPWSSGTEFCGGRWTARKVD